MYKFLFICCLVASVSCLNAQTIADFENYTIGENAFLNGSNSEGGFQSGAVFLPNTFTIGDYGDYWSGWALSSVTDNVSSGFANQYSAIPGSGAEDSNNYAVGFSFGGETLQLTNRSTLAGMYVTNATYTHNSMRDGDSFAKRFGGATGDDPDFLLLTIKSYLDGNLSTDSIDFYLGDYRAEDNTQDYLVKTWEWIDLSSLGEADSLLFLVNSSDVGDFGINTPTYFCVDNITTMMPTAVENLSIPSLSIYPNPTSDLLVVERGTSEELYIQLRDAEGVSLYENRSSEQRIHIDMTTFPKGVYFLELRDGLGVQTRTVLRQ